MAIAIGHVAWLGVFSPAGGLLRRGQQIRAKSEK
jgi:hypothetical protein